MLEAEGYKVAMCGRGTEARETLARRSFDVALVDWYMGEVPGKELLRAGLTTNPSGIVIVMTGNPSVASSIEALQAGASAFLNKPIEPLQLISTVRDLLGTSALARSVTKARVT